MTKSRQFSILFVVCLMALIGAYAWFFIFWVVKPKPIVPTSYKQFLLEYVEGPRIVIESGSNAYHSVNGTLMESLTGYPIVILSDHAGASLYDKIERLRRYGHQGDVVIMPLEWSYYVAEKCTLPHLATLPNQANFYFHSLSRISQIRRVFETPLVAVFNQAFEVGLHKKDGFFDELRRIDFYTHHHLPKSPCGGAADVDVKRLKMSAKDKNCDDYLFSFPYIYTDGLSDSFIDNLEALSKLRKEKGMNVILIPPVVVGYDCYKNKSVTLEKLLAQAKQEFEKRGIPYLDDYQRYAFDGDSFLNTHYHIDMQARDAYTPMIVGDLVEAGLLHPRISSGKPLTERLPGLVDKMSQELFAAKMPRWRGNPTKIIHGDDRGIFYLGLDWYDEEDWGRWAKGEEAEIVFCPSPRHKFTGLYVNAQYYNGSQETAVYINDQFIGRQDFSVDHVFEFGKLLREWMGDSSVVRLRFESSGLTAPSTLGVENDPRPLKFGIHSLQLIEE